MTKDELAAYFEQLATRAKVPALNDDDVGLIVAVVKRAGALRIYGIRRSAAVLTETRTAGVILSEQAAKKRAVAALTASVSVWDQPPPAKGGRWPTRTARARATGTDLAEADGVARRACVTRLVEELKRLNLSVVAQSGPSLGGGDRLAYLAAGKRTGTLRRRLGDWSPLRKWLAGQSRAEGFPAARDLLDYLEARAAEPCGKTVLQSALEAVIFFETVGGVPQGLKISQDGLVLATVSELSAGLASKRPEDRRQANSLPVKLITWLEATVMDVEQPKYVRYYAWLRLLKYWAALRFDDLRWIEPAKVEMTASGLRLSLTRTKVTGPGKKIGTLVAFVCYEAYFTAPGWLTEGFNLRRESFANIRCMFPLPTADLQGALDVPGEYSDASSASQALFASLPGPKPVGDTDAVAPSLETFRVGIHMLPPGAGLFWTEHSERNGLPTAAAALGYPDDTPPTGALASGQRRGGVHPHHPQHRLQGAGSAREASEGGGRRLLGRGVYPPEARQVHAGQVAQRG
jgi:hypothetical protein